MYVCICNRITDGDIKKSVNQGAANLQDLQQALGVASSCGQCANLAEDILSQHLQLKIDPSCYDLPYAIA